MYDGVAPYHFRAPESALEDLRRRLATVRWPDQEYVSDWSQGVPTDYLKLLVAYWLDGYDWRRAEAELEGHPQVRTILDGLQIHALHVRSPEPEALPLVLTHGWPGSVLEFRKVIGPLSDPRSHGGDPADAFNIVCPSLPGFGFSERPTTPGWSVDRIARAWGVLMSRLGYRAWVAQGGDWGALVATSIAAQRIAGCRGIHLNRPVVNPDPTTMSDLTPAEERAIESGRQFAERETGYARLQMSRPQTLGFALADSPVGLAAWILEKYHAWSDCNGDVESVFSRDEVLDTVTLYWLTNTATSSARMYWECFPASRDGAIELPTGISIFPAENANPSRRWAQARYKNLIYWNEVPRGGHFPALEQPEHFIDEVRNCFRQLRPGHPSAHPQKEQEQAYD